MYSVVYNEKVIFFLKWFIDSYKNNFIDLIKNWWLFWEEEIINDYISIWDKLYENIKKNIEINLSNGIVYWRHVNKNNYYVSVTINNFRLFVYYQENTIKKIRKIYKLKVHKK